MIPLASIIIPVAAAHAHLLAQAVASCRWQTLPDWEVIVINDTGQPLRSQGDARITVIDAPLTAGNRASAARNAGIAQAAGQFCICLDADDYLLPGALKTFVRGHARHDKAYSYAHHYGLSQDGAWAQYRPPEYNREPRASPMSHSTAGTPPAPTMQGCNLHPITAFVPTWCVREVGGFDEDAPGFDDWSLWLRLARAGFCGERIYGATFVYRQQLGINHRPDARGGQALMDAVTAPYRNTQGDIDMAGCGCGGGAKTAKDMTRQLAATFGDAMLTDNGMVTLEYTGPGSGRQSLRHPQSGREYRPGGLPSTKYILVPPEDVDYLIGLGFFVRQQPAPAFVPPPMVEEAQIQTTAKPEQVAKAVTKAAKVTA